MPEDIMRPAVDGNDAWGNVCNKSKQRKHQHDKMVRNHLKMNKIHTEVLENAAEQAAIIDGLVDTLHTKDDIINELKQELVIAAGKLAEKAKGVVKKAEKKASKEK